MSGVENTTGGGITTFDFIVNKFIGLRGIRLLTSLSKSVVKGQEFTIASTSTNSAHTDLLPRIAPWVFRGDSKILLADLICFSHTPPMLLAVGRFLFLDIHSPLLSCINWLFFFMVHFCEIFVSSAEAPTKFVPLSDLISLTFSL